ncbi:divergent polysaccharide deacetylase family protein [Salinibius halmophilus]|uniref:divergent polysaccharide deacetylase family protein n=1 Tax=Salinibius halmophilus TaxID=1853216 RepID=UPI000E6705DE|nr:divergent polysaccharide deacetylase family protein [Salinibius halmophilus]
MQRLGISLLLFISSLAWAGDKYLAIVIDDLGNNRTLGERAVALPAPITFAVLPNRPFSSALAERAFQNGHELMLHQPMANHSGFPLGAHGLTPDMTDSERLITLHEALASVPHARGFNNHLGSLLTENKQAMDALFQQHLPAMYFVDSVTTANSNAYSSAKLHGWPVTKRDVFLDHEATVDFVSQQMLYAMRLLDEKGHALVIGHPYEATLSYLELALPILADSGITLLPVSQYIERFGSNAEHLAEQKAEQKDEQKIEAQVEHVVR